ncbi:MAG: argininosuccinate synthase [Armatimonadetes bacterium]|jgi:argininosuccinate synthase|nr:argininosuccinate synthase [Armatimonadota bacterium]MDI9601125.1 argininosuccinate synthase [Acidobacteriota bacterium]NLN89190.1 argininosuccinate synthase [candidate division WS1 bacterium]
MSGKIVLAYSGGLDTSVAVRWVKEERGLDVVAIGVDVGEERDYDAILQKALAVGALPESRIIDAKEEFVTEYIWPALKAGACYESKYYLATALARPLIAKLIVDVAHEVGATAVGHGSTGKGNDQVRFDVTFAALDGKLDIVAPAREWGMTREEEIEYAERFNIPVPIAKASPYSIDVNLWGRSVECGIIEDAAVEPPEDAYEMTVNPVDAPDTPQIVEITFEKGVPVAIDGDAPGPVALVEKANKLAGSHGVGRVDMLENRLVGIKSREVYESPAAVLLSLAHREMEALTLDRDTAHYKALVAQRYSELVYFGLWHSPLREHLQAFVDSTQERVSGKVRMKLYKGSCFVVGRESPESLYRTDLATYDVGDMYDASAGAGFCKIWGLPVRVAQERDRASR